MAQSSELKAILRQMRALADPAKTGGMERFGIDATAALGLNVPQVRALARKVGKNQPLAEELWATGIHEARWLAAMVGDPNTITRSTMDRWARDFNSLGRLRRLLLRPFRSHAIRLAEAPEVGREQTRIRAPRRVRNTRRPRCA